MYFTHQLIVFLLICVSSSLAQDVSLHSSVSLPQKCNVDTPRDGKCTKNPNCCTDLVGDGVWSYDGEACSFFRNLCEWFRDQCYRLDNCYEMMIPKNREFCKNHCRRVCKDISPMCIVKNGIQCTVRSYCDYQFYVCITGDTNWSILDGGRCSNRTACESTFCASLGPWRYQYDKYNNPVYVNDFNNALLEYKPEGQPATVTTQATTTTTTTTQSPPTKKPTKKSPFGWIIDRIRD